ncbi:MAG TPA: alpha/beta hydrolase-fold protein [Candidatus Dormibacteraeota bacterium]
MRLNTAFAAALCVLTLPALAACGSAAATPSPPTLPAGHVSLDSCVQPSDQARAVTFSAADEQVPGAEFGGGTVGVVLAHEYMANLCGWVAYAKHLRDLGYRALAFDFRTHLAVDVSGAAQQLRSDGATRIVLVGASMGGTGALVAAASSTQSIAAVAALSAPTSFMGLDGLAASRQLTLPVLFMAAQDNGEFPGDARAMYAACPSAHKQLEVLSGSDHGTQLLRGSVAAQAMSLLDTFIATSAA